MDEILSSIRQIIADDDAAPAPRRPAYQPSVVDAAPAVARPMAPLPKAAPAFEMPTDVEDDEPLALSAAQIVAEPEETPQVEAISFGADFNADDDLKLPEPSLVDMQDVTFVAEDDEEEAEPEAEIEMEEPMQFSAPIPEPQPVGLRLATPTIAETAPMPDPTLSSDLAEQLLEPTTDAAVRHTFSRITHLPVGNEGLTLEALMRDMLRPMLKEWLDENLPTVVERMVEKEIARVSRGLE
jgi:hypothetical protein